MQCPILTKTVVVMLGLAAIPATISAQWPDYRTAGVARGPDGKPKLDAPAPRTADGKPDLSGIWVNFRTPRGGQAGGAGGRGGANANAAAGAVPVVTPPGFPPDGGQLNDPAPDRPVGQTTGGPPLATFFDVGAGIKDGLPLLPWAADVLKSRKAENSKDNPDAHCLPLGLMQLHLHPQPRKIIQTPGVTLILYEAQGGVRQIFTDGRPLPPADVQPWWYGYSIGKWDGDTLVVETVGFRDDVWLDVYGSPLTNTGKMIERFRRVNYGNLEIVITIEDPKAYSKPFTVKVDQRILADTDLIEFICTENDRSAPHLVGK
jgi:hypothetical protein